MRERLVGYLVFAFAAFCLYQTAKIVFALM